MSKVVNQPDTGAGGGTGATPTPAPAGQPQQDWILDDGKDDRPRQRWVMDESPLEQQERQQLREQFRQQGGGGGGVPAPAGQPDQPQPQFVPGAQPGQGFQYTTKSGYTFRGPSPDAVLTQMENALVGMAGRIQQIESARTFMNDQGGYDRGTSQRESTPTSTTRSAFDKTKFYEALAKEDPMGAIHMAMQEYFGVDDPRHALDRSYTVAQKIEDRLETADFLTNNPHFPASDANADLILRRIDQAGVPLTRWNMEVAFNQLMQERAIVPVYQQPQPDQAQPQPQFQGGNGNGIPGSRGAGAPPTPGGSGTGADDANREMSEMEFEILSTAEQRAYLVKRGLI